MVYEEKYGVPKFQCEEFVKKAKAYALLIPVINEGERIKAELCRAKEFSVQNAVDIVICDGGSDDGSMEKDILTSYGVNTLLIKRSSGRQGAQLRMGIWWALERGYKGIVTIDGNNKDSIEDVPSFVKALESGYDFVQGSRFISGGRAINTPLLRLAALRLIHAPFISLAARFRYTDTTNAFRAYSVELLKDERISPLRPVFNSYELLAYLSVRVPRLGYKTIEIPVTRTYPPREKTPTKIHGIRGNMELLSTMARAALGVYSPK